MRITYRRKKYATTPDTPGIFCDCEILRILFREPPARWAASRRSSSCTAFQIISQFTRRVLSRSTWARTEGGKLPVPLPDFSDRPTDPGLRFLVVQLYSQVRRSDRPKYTRQAIRSRACTRPLGRRGREETRKRNKKGKR